MKTIGILGGMGPVASSNLYRQILDLSSEYHNAKQDNEFPQIIINSLPLDGFNEKGFENPVSILAQLKPALKTLERAGADFVVIACNTVHFFIREMQNFVEIPIVNLLKEVLDEIVRTNSKRVGILSSETTKRLGLYTNILEKQGIKYETTTDKEQQILDQIILNIMSGERIRRDKYRLKRIVHRMQEDGIDTLLIGCTELPLLISKEDFDLNVVNSSLVLAEKAVEKAYNHR